MHKTVKNCPFFYRDIDGNQAAAIVKENPRFFVIRKSSVKHEDCFAVTFMLNGQVANKLYCAPDEGFIYEVVHHDPTGTIYHVNPPQKYSDFFQLIGLYINGFDTRRLIYVNVEAINSLSGLVTTQAELMFYNSSLDISKFKDKDINNDLSEFDCYSIFRLLILIRVASILEVNLAKEMIVDFYKKARDNNNVFTLNDPFMIKLIEILTIDPNSQADAVKHHIQRVSAPNKVEGLLGTHKIKLDKDYLYNLISACGNNSCSLRMIFLDIEIWQALSTFKVDQLPENAKGFLSNPGELWELFYGKDSKDILLIIKEIPESVRIQKTIEANANKSEIFAFVLATCDGSFANLSSYKPTKPTQQSTASDDNNNVIAPISYKKMWKELGTMTSQDRKILEEVKNNFSSYRPS